jgi:rhodanese-related sulfurtransferase
MLMEFVQQNILIVAVTAVSGGMLVWSFINRSGIPELTPAQATLLINREDARVLDVREVSEFAGGHLPEARNIPLDKLGERVSELEKSKESALLVCCASGVRSQRACGILKKEGFTRVHNLAGGVGAWQQAGLPLKKGNK